MTAPVAAGDAGAAGAAEHPAPAAAALDRARLKLLRAGHGEEKLFLVPGIEGVLEELGPLTAACTGPQAIYAVAPSQPDTDGRPMSDVEDIAEAVLAVVRYVQPSGPYHIGGYSFGGLVALEAARKLRATGEDVEALFLIDAVYDERYWPRRIWLWAILRRTTWQLSRIARMAPAQAVGELRRRATRLVHRVIRRRTDTPDSLPAGADGSAAAARGYAALSIYRPRHYAGTVTVIAPTVDRHFGCDTARLWAPYATRIEVQRVDGDHLSMMQEPTALAAVARVIDHRILTRRAGLRAVPGFERPMILSTMRWFSAARLGHALTEAGFAVSACRPAGHPLGLVDGLTSDHRLHRTRQLRSLARAIRVAQPDIILPDDERAVVLLRRLYAQAKASDAQTAAVVARSLGDFDGWPLMTSRAALANEARRIGVLSPDTAVVGDSDALDQWSAGRRMPIVLKTDGSWGGRGVAVVRVPDGLRPAWRAISSPPRLTRAVKRLLVNREGGPLAGWATRRRPVVNVQEFVEGREAIVTAACVHGKVTALVCLEVVQASEERGPASVVRVIGHDAMAQAVRLLAARLGLHGFCGFDFVITESGDAQLLELNARITPTAHLLVEGYRVGETLVLFPPGPAGVAGSQATGSRSAGPWSLDVPVRAPVLVRFGERVALRQTHPVTRLARRLQQKVSARLDGQHVR